MSSSSSRALALLFAAGALPVLLASACSDPTPPPAQSMKVAKVVSTGCFSSQNAPKGFMSQTPLQVGSEARTYDWLIPDIHDGIHPIPLVFVFDGGPGKGANARATYPLEAVAAGQAAFVYPDTDTSATWDVDRGPENNADVAFYDAMLTALQTKYCIDMNRVFVTGFGKGGTFANQLACFRGGGLRAVAAHEGTGPSSEEFSPSGQLDCPEKPIAALITQGQSDTTVTVSDGQASRDYWAGVNGCRPGGLQTFQTFAPCINLLGCSPDRPVVYCEVPGLDHSLWPEAPAATWALFTSL